MTILNDRCQPRRTLDCDNRFLENDLRTAEVPTYDFD